MTMHTPPPPFQWSTRDLLWTMSCAAYACSVFSIGRASSTGRTFTAVGESVLPNLVNIIWLLFVPIIVIAVSSLFVIVNLRGFRGPLIAALFSALMLGTSCSVIATGRYVTFEQSALLCLGSVPLIILPATLTALKLIPRSDSLFRIMVDQLAMFLLTSLYLVAVEQSASC